MECYNIGVHDRRDFSREERSKISLRLRDRLRYPPWRLRRRWCPSFSCIQRRPTTTTTPITGTYGTILTIGGSCLDIDIMASISSLLLYLVTTYHITSPPQFSCIILLRKPEPDLTMTACELQTSLPGISGQRPVRFGGRQPPTIKCHNHIIITKLSLVSTCSKICVFRRAYTCLVNVT